MRFNLNIIKCSSLENDLKTQAKLKQTIIELNFSCTIKINEIQQFPLLLKSSIQSKKIIIALFSQTKRFFNKLFRNEKLL